MELPVRFPEGTKFLRVQFRVPVTIGREGIALRWDNPTPPSPRHDASLPLSAVEQGVPISEDEFRALVVKSRAAAVAFKQRADELVEAMCRNLNRNVMAEYERENTPEAIAERLATEATRRAQLKARRGQ